ARVLHHKYGGGGGAGLIGMVLAAAEAFRRVRDWVSISPTEARTGSLASKLKPLAPQLLAYVVIFGSLVLVALGGLCLVEKAEALVPWVALTDVFFVLLVLWLVDPKTLGLRAFYRRRIVRTSLGASTPAACGQRTGPAEAWRNRCAIEHPEDD